LSVRKDEPEEALLMARESKPGAADDNPFFDRMALHWAIIAVMPMDYGMRGRQASLGCGAPIRRRVRRRAFPTPSVFKNKKV